MLLAFSATPEEIDVLLISLTFGNIDVQNCLRNAVSLFHHIEQEIEWRSKNGKELGFDTLRASKPMIAVGAQEPLAEQLMMADFFRMHSPGIDFNRLPTDGRHRRNRWPWWHSLERMYHSQSKRQEIRVADMTEASASDS